jgi:hypothetical protein
LGLAYDKLPDSHRPKVGVHQNIMAPGDETVPGGLIFFDPIDVMWMRRRVKSPNGVINNGTATQP